MTTDTQEKNELITATDEAVTSMLNLMSALDENKINTIPYPDSWTAAQLFRHVTMVISGSAQAMRMEAKPAERSVDERVPELKKTFLDFSTKMQSPGFVVPEDGPYEKHQVMEALSTASSQFREHANNTDLTGIMENPALGPLTKLELLHFIVYHTQRHLNQLNKISEALAGQ